MEFRNNRKNRTPRPVDFSAMMYGKVPPQAREMEEAVLGALLLDPEAYGEINGILRDINFYVDAHQRIYRVIEKMHADKSPIDILTLAEELRAKEELDMVGGPYFLTKLTNCVVSTAHIQAHAKIIYQKYIKREILKLNAELMNECFEDSTVDPFDLLDDNIAKLKGIYNQLSIGDNVDISKEAFQVVVDMEERMRYGQLGEKNPNDRFTGIKQWDKINGALFPGLYVVAGRPAMGKGVHMTEVVCDSPGDEPVGVINGEMSTKQFLIRVGCNKLELDNSLWKKEAHLLTPEDIANVNAAMETASMLNMHIHNKRDIHGIVKKIRYWVKKCGVKKVLIDFLGILTVSEEYSKYKGETEITNYILDKILGCCNDFGIPIILYVQLNRELYKSGNKEPNLSHLKQSGKIEELAYQVSFLHRPEYYDPENPVDEMGNNIKGLMYQIIAKHRDGLLGRIKYRFLGQYSKLIDWDYEPAVEGWNAKSGAPF